ncbi:MAG: SWIM zinc finger family protein [Lacipirellulaceae bacterium]
MPHKKKPSSRAERSQAAAPSSHVAAWAELTRDDLDRAFDSRSVTRGRSYQRDGQVKKLAVADDGRLLATVFGTQRYATSARLASNKKSRKRVEGTCSCPVGSQCKHAVAVVAEYLAQLADGESPPTAAVDDPRWARLASSSADESYDDEGEYNEDEDEGDEDEGEDSDDAPSWMRVEASRRTATRSALGASAKPKGAKPAAKGRRRTTAEWDALIKADVEKKSAAELAGLVLAQVRRFPELRKEFQERILLGEGDAPRLVAEARKELRAVTSELGWRNYWRRQGHTPDYRRLKHRLERLVELGQADAVVKLGRELFERGMSQVEQSQDEGETGAALAECFPVVFGAVAESSLTPAERILYAIDACELDQWDYVGEPAAAILGAPWTRIDWSAVSDVLADRLNRSPGEREDSEADDSDSSESWSFKYRRDSLSGRLAHALQKAGRGDEVLALYEAEVRRTGSYERLVDYLLGLKRFDDAERWAREGIDETCEQFPGTASHLADKLIDVARRRKQWDVVAARAACEFFRRPSVESFRSLTAAAEKAKCGPAVRRRALLFLEEGVAPVRCEASPVRTAKGAHRSPGKRGAKSPKRKSTAATPPAPLKIILEADWPLPLPEYLAAAFLRPQGPHDRPQKHRNVLVDIAIAEKRPEEALRWYDQIVADERATPPGGPRPYSWSSAASIAPRVAAAVAVSHPERALEVYRCELDSYLPHANQGAYESATACLRKMRPIMRSLDRDDYWVELVKDIRERYRNRPRFMEALDTLEGRRIVATQKRRR